LYLLQLFIIYFRNPAVVILPSLQERRRNWSVIALTRNPDISNEGVAMVIMFYENAPWIPCNLTYSAGWY